MVDLFLSKESGQVARRPFRWQRVLITARDAVLALVMPAIILGGMFAGVYTPTEGAAVAVAMLGDWPLRLSDADRSASVYESLRDSAVARERCYSS